MLKRLHVSHQWLEATLRRARQHILARNGSRCEEQVANCKACRRDAPEQKKETLLSHAVPNKPWRKVGMDILLSNCWLLLRLLRIWETERHVISGSDRDLQEMLCETGNTRIRALRQRTSVFRTWICYLQQWVGLPAHNQLAVSLPVEWESRVKCQIGEETLETSCRSTTCAVRIQKHDYSWYDNKPESETVASIHEVYHTAAGLWSNRWQIKPYWEREETQKDTVPLQQACARLTSNQRRFPGTHKRLHIEQAKVERCACVETTKWSLVQCCFTRASVT